MKAKDLKANLSAILKQALKEKLAEQEAQVWAKENKQAIQAYNAFVEEQGCFGDEYRSF